MPVGRGCPAVAVFFAILSPAWAQKSAVDEGGHEWWHHAVFCEIYPRSFADSNDDGLGDLPRITSKLDYLRWLGVDAIWIAPMFPSPQVAWGYDISDSYSVTPEYGTLRDMDELLAEGKKRNIRLLLDLVLTYTSDQHTWSQESTSSRTNPKRDFYLWRDGKAPGGRTTGRPISAGRRGSTTPRPASFLTHDSANVIVLLSNRSPPGRQAPSTIIWSRSRDSYT